MAVNIHLRKALYRFVLYGAFLFTFTSASAGNKPGQTSIGTFREILSLKLKKANQLSENEIRLHPDQTFSFYLLDYSDFLAAFISEENDIISKYHDAFGLRTSKIQSSEEVSPYTDFLTADMYLRNALIRIKSGEFVTAATGMAKAFRLFKKNDERYPSFLPDKIGLGVLHILAGAAPEKYKDLLKILGYEGSIEKGMNELRQVVNYHGDDEFLRICRFQALFFLAVTESGGNPDKTKGYSLLNDYLASEDFLSPSNPLLIFIRATICMRSGRNDEAISALSLYHPSPDAIPFYYLDFLRGKALLNRLDPQADYYLRSFVTGFRGKTYVKSAYQRLAWYSLINGRKKDYEMYQKMTLIAGVASSETDRQAQREMSPATPPSVPLLKARLLFDGGYYDRALDELLGTAFDEIVSGKKELLEYNYRLGRICQETGKNDKAIFYFNKVIDQGSAEPWYFAANSALQKGLILEKEGNYEDAKAAFEKCLSMDPAEYKSTLNQKARVELQRMKKIN